MATNIWKGGAKAVAQVDKVTPGGTIDAGYVYSIIINGRSVQYVAADDTVTGVTAGITAAFNASTLPEFAEITAADATTHVTLTADTAGVPFTIASAVAGSGGSFSSASVTANSGPNDASVVSNWSTGSVPGSDDVVFEDSSVDCLYNLNQLGNVLSLRVKSSYTGKIGLPRNNANGYVEYRPRSLSLGTAVTTVDIGEGEGSGSSRINLAVGNRTAATTITVSNTGRRASSSVPPLLITTGTQSNTTTLVVNKGDVGVATYAGETAVINVLMMGQENRASEAKVELGSGVTATGGAAITSISKMGGSLVCHAKVTTLTNNAGSVEVCGTYAGGTVAVTTATLIGGTLYWKTNGTLTTLYVTGDAVFDLRQDARSRTVSAAKIYQKGAIYDPSKTVTWAAGIDLHYCGVSDVTLDLGEHLKLSPGAVS